MASLQESFKAALENAQMAASLLSIEQDRAERDAARDWPHLRDCLVHTFSNASPIPLSEGDRPGDILGAANAIATLQARLKEEELLEALGWLRKLSIVAMKLVKTTARRPSSEEVKVKAEPPHFAPVETLILDSDDEASIDEKPIIPVDEKPAAAPPLSPPAPPASNASRPNRRSPARQASESVASSTSSTPAPTPAPPPARNDRRRSRAPGPEVKGEEKEAPPAKKPRARAKAPAPPPPLNYPEPLSVITNPFELPQNLNRPSPTTLKQMREVGSFHNEDFPGSNTGTFRKADMFGWRIFLSSWVNLGIDWESPKPGEPCVMLNAMKQDTKGIWVDSRWLELAREHLNSGAPIGVVVAAANSIANPADGGGKQRVPLGRYIVRDMGSAPAGAFSRASKEGRDAALASLRQHAIKSLDWSIQRAGLFRNTDLKELTTNAKAGSEDFMEHLGKELDNSKQDQHLTYTILEYHSPYDQAELEVAKEERRTGVKKAAMTAARKATRVRNAEQKKAGTYVPKRKGKKKVVDPPPESDSEESDSAQRSEWESAREEVSEESDESEEDEDDSYED